MTLTITDGGWRKRAVCALETSGAPELWTSDRRPKGVVGEAMVAMCQRCPVRPDCARTALETGADTGMYAGVWVPEQSQGQAWQLARTELQSIVQAASGSAGPVLAVSA